MAIDDDDVDDDDGGGQQRAETRRVSYTAVGRYCSSHLQMATVCGAYAKPSLTEPVPIAMTAPR